MKKKYIAILIFASVVISMLLAGCVSEKNKDELDTGNREGVYLTFSESGVVSIIDESMETVSSLQLGSNGDFIFATEDGSMRGARTQVVYALDKTTRILKVILHDNRSLYVAETYIIDQCEVAEFKAYNGVLYFKTSTPFKTPVRAREERTAVFGEVIGQRSMQSSFYYVFNIYNDVANMLNVFEEGAVFEKEKLVASEIENKVIQLPFEVEHWFTDNRYVYFFTNNIMGMYNMQTNTFKARLGLNMLKDIAVDVEGGSVYVVGHINEKHSRSVLLDICLYTLNVKRSASVDYTNSTRVFVDNDSKEIVIFFRNDRSAQYSTHIRTLDKSSLRVKRMIGSEYVLKNVAIDYGKAISSVENGLLFVGSTHSNNGAVIEKGYDITSIEFID